MKKVYKEKVFRKQVLGRIYLPQDKAFVESMFITENGSVRLKDDPDSKDLKRLAKLGKAIKKNKGMLRIGRLAVPAVIIAGVMVFSLVFKDRLLADAMQSGLEYIFQARSEVEGLNLRLLSGSVEIDRITVANQSRPMQNLFEAEDLRLNILVPALFERKLVIEDMQIGRVQHDTPRTTSGTLPSQPLDPLAENGIAPAESLFELELPSLSAEDARRMVEEQAESLEIVQSIRDAQEFADSTYNEWNSQIEQYSNQVESLQNTIQDVRRLDPAQLTSVAQFENARAVIQSATGELQTVQQSVGQPLQTMQQDIAQANNLIREAAQGIDGDIEMLKAQIGDLTADPGELLLDIGMSMLSQPAIELIETVRTAHLRLQRLQSLREQFVSSDNEADRSSAVTRGGIDVPFPAQQYPTLFLGRALSAYSIGAQSHTVELHQLSSDASVTNAASEFMYQGSGESSTVSVSGYMPLHQPEEPQVQIATIYSGLPVNIEHNAPGLGTIELSGRARINWDTNLRSLDEIGTNAEITIEDPVLSIRGGNPVLSGLITSAVEEAGYIQMEAEARMQSGRFGDLQGRTNLDSLLREGMQNILQEQRAEIEAAVERELRALVERERERLAPAEARINELRSQADEVEQLLRRHQQAKESKREELMGQVGDWDQARRQFEQRLRQQATELEDTARAEVEAAAEAARREAEEAERRAREEQQRLEEEARQRAREEQRRQEEEARRRAEEEARRRLPGF